MARKYETEFMDYHNADTYYVETFINIKRIIKIKGITGETSNH